MHERERAIAEGGKRGKMYTLTCAISVSHSSKCSKVCEDGALQQVLSSDAFIFTEHNMQKPENVAKTQYRI